MEKYAITNENGEFWNGGFKGNETYVKKASDIENKEAHTFSNICEFPHELRIGESITRIDSNDLKKPEEIPPEGYRLVTDEEKRKYHKNNLTNLCKTWWHGEWSDGDIVFNLKHWLDTPLAVPLDFTFEPDTIEITAVQAAKDLAGQYPGKTVKVVM